MSTTVIVEALKKERGDVPALLRAFRSPRPSPGDAVVFAVVARPAPHRPVRAVEEDGVDGAGGALLVSQLVAHATQLRAHPGRHRLGEQDAAGPRLVRAEGAAHL